MSNRSRVEKYAELRQRIDNMDVYTFDDPIITQKAKTNMEDTKTEEVVDTPMSSEEVAEAHIKKNTLSLSIDELIKQHEDYTRTLEKGEIDKKMKDMKKVEKAKRHNNRKVSLSMILWISLCVIGVITVIFLGLILGGVI